MTTTKVFYSFLLLLFSKLLIFGIVFYNAVLLREDFSKLGKEKTVIFLLYCEPKLIFQFGDKIQNFL